MRDQLNSLLRGWCAYFGYGTRLIAYRAVDHHVYHSDRRFLVRRHKVQSQGIRHFRTKWCTVNSACFGYVTFTLARRR